MPAVVDPSTCNRNWALCFAARVCPNDAFSQTAAGDVVINSDLCADCPGPCTNFCDGYAIRFDPDPDAFEILKRQTLGDISEQEAVDERIALEEQKRLEAETMNGGAVIDVTEETFVDEVLTSALPVVVDFWASWCGPCKQMAPVFDELAREYAGLVKFVKVNVDEQPVLAGQFRVQSIPTLLVFHNGRPIDGAVGALPKQQLQSLLYSVLSQARAGEAVEAAPNSVE